MSTVRSRPKILFVDDELRLLESIALVLRKEYDVETAISGSQALRKLAETKDVAVVVSDFRMPTMDGATLLHEVMLRAPTATRILLTGEAGVNGAKDAVNKGHIFHFLTKPCPTDELKSVLEAGVSHHRLQNSERRVMQETLLECIAALMEVLAVTNPVAFGRAQRIKQLVADLSARLDCGQFWQLEAAALLSQIGFFAVSPELAEKMYYGRPLGQQEQARAAAVPSNAQRLFEHIPRLEPVIQILAATDWSDEQVARLGNGMIGLGARILGVAVEYDAKITKNWPAAEALQSLKSRAVRYGSQVLDALADCVKPNVKTEPDVVIVLRDACKGMRLREEIRTSTGALLVPIGFEISARLLDRLTQVAPEVLKMHVRVSPNAVT